MDFKKLKIKIKVCYSILFGKYRHWAVIHMDKSNLEKLLKDESFEANIVHHGVQPYIYYRMIIKISEILTWEEMILEKAKFEFEAEEHRKSQA